MDSGNVEHGDAHLLCGNFLDVGFSEAKCVTIIGNGSVKTLDGDADMVILLNHMRMVFMNAGISLQCITSH